MIRTHDQGSRRAAGAAGPRTRPEARRAPELAHLTLDELRTYRQELLVEETRVSYWRRIVQARLDLVIGADDADGLGRLGGVLTDHAASSRRLALLPVTEPGGRPALPDLAVLWEVGSGAGNDDAADAAVNKLAGAEHELSTYRRSLHQRLDAATGELIARYREKPALALTALPGGSATGVVA